MILGHYGLAFAAKRVAPHMSLGTLFFATLFIDFISHALIPIGIEVMDYDPVKYPYVFPVAYLKADISHSLLATCGWGLLLAGIYWFWKRSKNALWLLALVVSHWVLDICVHVHGLPLYPTSETLVGLGVWKSFNATVILELGLFIAGVWLCLTRVKPQGQKGRIGFWFLVALLIDLYLYGVIMKPPPGPSSLWFFSLLDLIVIYAFWLDRYLCPTAEVK